MASSPLASESNLASNHLAAEAPFSDSDDQMLTHIRNTAPQLLQKLQSGLSQLPFELVWSAHAQWPLPPSSGPAAKRPLRISVLDSSFNPPTLAHLALANSKRPTATAGSGSSGDSGDYDAKLLLLSVKNADKTLKPGDASYLQRLQMMGLLSQDVVTDMTVADGQPNVAIGIIDEPTFVGKSRILKEYFGSRIPTLRASVPPSSNSDATVPTQLTFIVGMDTLERLFSPKYYPTPPDPPEITAEQRMMEVLSRMFAPPPGGEDSFIVCAKRASLPSDITQQSNKESGLDQTIRLASKMGWLADEDGRSRVNEGSGVGAPKGVSGARITLIDIGDRESRFSSTAVRNARERIGPWGETGGGPWKEWVTKRVAAYIEKERLYLS